VGNSGTVRKKMLNCDLSTAFRRVIGKIVADCRIEIDQSLFDHLQNQHICEVLRNGTDGESGIRFIGDSELSVSQTIAFADQDLVADGHKNGAVKRFRKRVDILVHFCLDCLRVLRGYTGKQ